MDLEVANDRAILRWGTRSSPTLSSSLISVWTGGGGGKRWMENCLQRGLSNGQLRKTTLRGLITKLNKWGGRKETPSFSPLFPPWRLPVTMTTWHLKSPPQPTARAAEGILKAKLWLCSSVQLRDAFLFVPEKGAQVLDGVGLIPQHVGGLMWRDKGFSGDSGVCVCVYLSVHLYLGVCVGGSISVSCVSVCMCVGVGVGLRGTVGCP